MSKLTKARENDENPEVIMLAPTTDENYYKIQRENKPNVLKIVWAHTQMLFGTTEG